MKTTSWDMRKVKKVEHPLVEAWAKKHYALELEMMDAIGKMTDSELQALRHAITSLTMTNCWFAEYDVKETLEGLIGSEERTREQKRRDAAQSSTTEGK